MAPLTGSACRSCGMFVRHFKSWGLNCSFLDSRSGALLMKSRHISPIRERGNLILSHPDGGRAGFPVGLGQEESLFMETSLLSGPSTDRPPDLIRFPLTRDLGRAIEETYGKILVEGSVSRIAFDRWAEELYAQNPGKDCVSSRISDSGSTDH